MFHGKRHPKEIGVPEVEAFLTNLAVERNVAVSTQGQAKAALLFLYREVLNIDLPWSCHGDQIVKNQGEPILWEITNNVWHTALAKAELKDFRFHDLRHTWASWHRQAGTSCDELKDLGGWKSRIMVDSYAKYATEHLRVAAARIEDGRGGNVLNLSRFCRVQKEKRN